jgi:hypothetical protein
MYTTIYINMDHDGCFVHIKVGQKCCFNFFNFVLRGKQGQSK